MTTSTAPLLLRRPRSALRADQLLAALLVAAVVGIAALAALTGAAGSSSGAAGPLRVALVVDAGARPDTALASARAAAAAGERAGAGAGDVAVRVPRTSAEAAADVRYFAAQRRVRTVVVVGPLTRAAARAAAADYPRARFAARATVPPAVR